MVFITRRETFNAAHQLRRNDWTDEQNEAVFGKCAGKNWHGHNFILFVTVKGQPNPGTGFIIDLKLLSKLIKTHIVDKVDHQNLNLDVDFMYGIMPSIENLAIQFWKILAPLVTSYDSTLHCIKIVETENNYVEYYGD